MPITYCYSLGVVLVCNTWLTSVLNMEEHGISVLTHVSVTALPLVAFALLQHQLG